LIKLILMLLFLFDVTFSKSNYYLKTILIYIVIYIVMSIKVESYTVLDNNIVLKFNKSFTQITYIKSQSFSKISDTSVGELDSEEIGIKYSKPKNTINLFITSDCHFLSILITNVDDKPLYYSWYLNELAKGTNNKIKEKIKYMSIKNENIFAILKKKSLL